MNGPGYATRLLALTCAVLLATGLPEASFAETAVARSASVAQPRALIYQPDKWSALAPAQKQAVRSELLRILEKNQASEIARLPAIVTLSDAHGTIDKFDALLLHALRSVSDSDGLAKIPVLDPDRSLAEQLAGHGVRLDDFRGRIFFHNGGDLVDRGPRGLAILKRTQELMAAGLMDFVIGNHDLWMFLNLQGVHLPSYPNFNFYGYRDTYDAQYGRVEDVVAAQLREAEFRSPEWWERKLAEFTVRQLKEQKNWEAPDSVKVRVNHLFKSLTAGKSDDEIKRWSLTREGALWNSLRGYDVKVGDVYIGVRAVSTVSLKWWQDLLEDFKANLPSVETSEARQRMELWLAAIKVIEQDIIPVLSRDIEERLARGEWWIRAFEALNYRNYESLEWWAKDWAFHNDWGTSVFKEISPAFKEDNLDAEVSFARYLNHPALQDASRFLRQNFRLYQQDLYGNTILHGLLPVDPKTGEFTFVYRGKEYRGRGSKTLPSVWQGLSRIENDVRNPARPLSSLHEALSLVNSWYADRTTIAKAINVADAVNRIGLDKMARVNGFSRLNIGHVPFHEFLTRLTPEQRGERIRGFLIDDRLVLTDHGMGKRFGSRGAYVVTSPRDGIVLQGYEHAGDQRIQAAPRTVEPMKGGQENVLSANKGLHPLVFRNYLLDELRGDLRQPTR
ncbi:MAG: hypothetical protein QMB52_10055 [Propionivibrio sp.]